MDGDEIDRLGEIFESLIDALRFTHDDKHVKLFKFINHNLFNYARHIHEEDRDNIIYNEWYIFDFKLDRFASDAYDFARNHVEDPTQCESFEVYMNDIDRKNEMLDELKNRIKQLTKAIGDLDGDYSHYDNYRKKLTELGFK